MQTNPFDGESEKREGCGGTANAVRKYWDDCGSREYHENGVCRFVAGQILADRAPIVIRLRVIGWIRTEIVHVACEVKNN